MSETPPAEFPRLAEIAEQLCVDRRAVRLMGLRGSARAVAIARLAGAAPDRPLLVLTPGAKETDRLLEDLREILGQPPPEEGGRVRPFPHPDTAPYDRFSPQPFVTAQRMDVLHRWACGEAPLVVAPWTALALRVPSRECVRACSVRLAVGECIDRDALVARLVAAGYARQPLVEERGEVAVRGGIIDLFPPQRARPVRLELLGDEIESLREFDPASQRSQAELREAVAPPARELLCRRDDIVASSALLRQQAQQEGVPEHVVDRLLDTLLRGNLPPGVEALAPLLQPAQEAVLDFLPDDALLVLDDPTAGRDRLMRFQEEAYENFQSACDSQRLVCPPKTLLLFADALVETLAGRHPISLERLETRDRAPSLAVKASGHEALSSALRQARGEGASGQALAPLVQALARWRAAGLRVVLTASTLSAATRLHALLEEYGVSASLAREPAPVWRWSAPGALEVRVGEVSEGFVLRDEGLVVVTEEEIFGPREKRRHAGSWREGAALEALGQLTPGDALVHVEHGIGIYRGLVLLELGPVRDEFLRLEYDRGDKLFVPVHRLNQVQRYVGAEGAPPKRDRLGGKSWEKTKRRVKRSMRNMAKELLEIHAAREVAPGFAFPPRGRALEEFEAAFPFEETPDQVAAVEDVLADLANPRPMDRLVCGDVGYGKTEVAARAAFQILLTGKQVAVLVPTTVLCQQHVETFRERFQGVPARIESLSRFCSAKQAKQILEGLSTGEVDVVIGTHRLLRKDMVFHDLGLLVVDEEHRFGVAHKERIKQLRQSVDVLTLTATPIPRTLQMAFTGIRDLSVIQTPPADRLAVRTQVCRFDETLIREAILREMQRGGQVFFVHNRVRSIGALAGMLRRVVPEARVLVAHGQMRERELEDRMLTFMHGEHDVLLCTTIIESGLDNPRANTILIDRADALGLAQLYQLRGRVGRSRHRAYAYLLIPGEAALGGDATRRLEAIQDLSELGSGFRLANMDLEIRGAGNLLGGEQSGNLGAVGYETYMELLEEAMEELSGGQPTVTVDPEIRLPLSARLPEAFVPDVRQRLVLYKRLAGAPDEASLERLQGELLDRFGPLPDEAQRLVQVIRLKIHARRLGVASIEIEGGWLVLRAAPVSKVDPAHLVALMGGNDPDLRVTPDHRVRARLPGQEPDAVFQHAHAVLARLTRGEADSASQGERLSSSG